MVLKPNTKTGTSEPVQTAAEIADLHNAHPQVRAQDWRSPLVRRLLKTDKHQDGACELADSFRPATGFEATEGSLSLTWTGLQADFTQLVKTYQEPVITEFATLGLACILLTRLTGLEITEVTRRGERADYWLGEREYLLEVSGQQHGSIESLCAEKADQLLDNPFDKAGYVCVASYDEPCARLWFYEQRKQSQ